MPDIERDSGHCPECGQRVGTFTTDAGATYYLAVAEQEASYADYLRTELDRVTRSRDDWKALAESADVAALEDRVASLLGQLEGAVEALREIHELAETSSVDADDLLGAISVKTTEAIRAGGR